MQTARVLVIAALCSGTVHAQPATGVPDKDNQTVTAIPPNKRTDPNPALLYWQAIALLPELNEASVRLIGDAADGKLKADESKVADVLAQTGKSLDRFVRAAFCDQPCVWGTTFDEGPFAPMPHLPKLQLLCRLALAQSEACFAEHRDAEALHTLLAVHRAARHLATDALLVTIVMQHTIEQQAIRLTARHVLALDEATRTAHAQALKELPPLRTVHEALTGENALAEWLRHMVLGIEHSPESEKALLGMAQSVLQAQSQSSDLAVATEAKEALKSVEEWKQIAQQARALQVRLETASTKPWKEFQADLQQTRSDLADANPALRNILPTFEGTMRKQCETQTLHTMLGAALAHGNALQSGELTGYNDAFEGKPLTVTRDRTAIVITSPHQVRGKPLALRVEDRL